jgi:hypothetical protein
MLAQVRDLPEQIGRTTSLARVTDWQTISSLATAGGTLVLAVATFYAVRSSNRAAQSAERALQVGLRPLLFPSRTQDQPQKLRWGDDHWALLGGGRAVLEEADGIVYLAISLRNVGSGIAVLHGWRIEAEIPESPPTASVEELRARFSRPDPASFRIQSRDIYVPPGDIGFWQAAMHEPSDPDRARVGEIMGSGGPVLVDLLYGDQEGGQRTISRFAVTQYPGEKSEWLCSVARHWALDRNGPR